MERWRILKGLGSRFFLVISLFIVFVGVILFVSVYGVSDIGGVTVEISEMDLFVGCWSWDFSEDLSCDVVFEFFNNGSFEMRITDDEGGVFGTWGSYDIGYNVVSMSLVCDSVFFGLADTVCIFDYEFSSNGGYLSLFNREPGLLDVSLLKI